MPNFQNALHIQRRREDMYRRKQQILEGKQKRKMRKKRKLDEGAAVEEEEEQGEEEDSIEMLTNDEALSLHRNRTCVVMQTGMIVEYWGSFLL